MTMKKDWMIKESDIYRAKDEGQIAILKAILDKSYVVTGSAGSGKSVLALIKAQHVQEERGNSYQIIVYTTSLCQYMDSGKKELGLCNALRYHKEWKYKRVPKYYANGETHLVYDRDKSGNEIPNNPLPAADYTIVDEIQDFTMQEIQEFINATGKHFFFFGDPAQSIYGKFRQTMSTGNIAKVFGNKEKIKEIPLYYNYRLPLPVAKLVQYIGIDLPPFEPETYKSKETDMPRVLGYANLTEQAKAICRLINMDMTDVAILLPNGNLAEQITNELIKLNMPVERRYKKGGVLINTLNFSTTTPKIMSYHSAKGLQFENVFIPALESFHDDKGDYRRALYTAMTRTYKRLYVMYSGTSLPDFWQQLNIPTDLYETLESEILEY